MDDYVEINGVRLELDLLDADVMEKYQELATKVADRADDETEYAECKTEADRMRIQCRIVDEFFNDLFGKGTAEEIFTSKNNLGKRLEAFGEVTELAQNAGNRVTQMTEQYSPDRLNREQRRAQKYQKGTQRKNPHDVKGMPADDLKNAARGAQHAQEAPQEPSQSENHPVRLTKEQFAEAMRIAKEAGLIDYDE